jgi:hypothetical protein
MLSVVLAVENFKFYLSGAHFWIRSDHKILTFLKSKSFASPRLARWRSRLIDHYDFTLVWRRGRDHLNADSFSRMNFPKVSKEEDESVDEEEILIFFIHIRLDLKQRMTFRASRHTKTQVEVVARKPYAAQIQGCSFDTWIDFILVPLICMPTSNKMCTIIDVSYSLDIVFSMSSNMPTISKDIGVPIVIGSLPIPILAQIDQ